MPPAPDLCDDNRLLSDAAQIFGQGFGLTRSFTHPFVLEQVEGLWVLRDAPRKNPIDYRREEWVAYGIPPATVDRIARKRTRGRYCLCVLEASGARSEEARAEYKALGYRLGAAEPL